MPKNPSGAKKSIAQSNVDGDAAERARFLENLKQAAGRLNACLSEIFVPFETMTLCKSNRADQLTRWLVEEGLMPVHVAPDDFRCFMSRSVKHVEIDGVAALQVVEDAAVGSGPEGD